MTQAAHIIIAFTLASLIVTLILWAFLALGARSDALDNTADNDAQIERAIAIGGGADFLKHGAEQ